MENEELKALKIGDDVRNRARSARDGGSAKVAEAVAANLQVMVEAVSEATDYLVASGQTARMTNLGTAEAPDWQAFGLLGESIHHQWELTNKGSTGLSTGEEAAFTLFNDEFFGSYSNIIPLPGTA